MANFDGLNPDMFSFKLPGVSFAQEPVQAKPEPEPAPKPAPAPSRPTPSAGQAGGSWAALRAELQKSLSMPDFMFIGNPDMVGGSISSDTVTVWLQADYLRALVDTPTIRTALENGAVKLWGHPFQLVFKVGKAPAEAPSAPAEIPTPPAEEFDALEAFLSENQGLGNITVSD